MKEGWDRQEKQRSDHETYWWQLERGLDQVLYYD